MEGREGFYNPFLKKNRDLWKKNKDGQQSRRKDHSYYTDIKEFKFVAPRCLDEDAAPSDRRGMHIGSLARSPKAYLNGKERNILEYSGEEMWPRRMLVWDGVSYRPDGYDPRFEKVHVYDFVETTETISADGSHLAERFANSLRPSGTVVTLLGMTACGKRIAIHVYGVSQYFYMNKVEIDAACGSKNGFDLAEKMASVLRASAFGGGGDGPAGRGNEWSGPKFSFKTATADCFEIDVVTRTDVYYFDTPSCEFYRIKARNGRFVSFICDNFYPEVKKYEGNVDALTRLILDNAGFSTFGWYRLKPGCRGEKVQVRRTENHVTSSDVEINCTPDNLEPDAEDAAWPEYKLMCFDIECKAGGANELAFPIATNQEDVVIQISCLLYSIRSKELEGIILFSLGSCDLSGEFLERAAAEGWPKPTVLEFDSEFELLLAFFTFLKQYSPEFVTGYNIVNFDWAYLFAKATKVYNMRLDGYGRMNRGGMFKVWEMGTNFFQKKSKVKINGVISLDAYSVAVDKLKIPSYKLDAVAEAALGERKKDLSYKDIPRYFAAGAVKRGVIGEYCIQDSVLAGKIFFKYLPHLELAAVARLAGIALSRVIFDGQQIRVFTCLLRLAGDRGFILPDFRGRFGSSRADDGVEAAVNATLLDSIEDDAVDDDESDEQGSSQGSGDKPDKAQASTQGRVVGYQGAKVLDPLPGFHIDPVTVFDFASLYPSIIQAHNLCYSTLTLKPEAVAHLKSGDDYLDITVGEQRLFFVRPHVRESLLSVLLKDWLAMRKSIRAKIPDSSEEEALLLDKQQAAIKVVCNSVYGFTGVSNGLLPCLQVAATVTTIGRDMLLATRDYVHEKWATPELLMSAFPDTAEYLIGGTHYEAKIIYGDTDSVFVRFSGVRPEGLVSLGDAMAKKISSDLFRAPIKLECEKTFIKLLLITKKKYIGVINGGKMLMKGVDLVRKNNCHFINSYAKRLVDLLFRDENVAAAAAEVTKEPAKVWLSRSLPAGLDVFGSTLAEAYRRIANGDLDVKDFVMTAELSRSPEAYVNKRVPHLTVYYKLMFRGEQVPTIKERVPYVVISQTQEAEKEALEVAKLRGDLKRPHPGDDEPDLAPGRRQPKKRKMLVSELAEDPVYVTSHSIPLNTDYYFSHLLSTLSVTFKALFNNDVKTTEILLRRFIPESHNSTEEVRERLVRAGFDVLTFPETSVMEEENLQKLSTAFCILAGALRPA
uniref:DNA polymerase n=1 Tax=Vulture herpesvirus TaxID=285986 RepID=Q697J3_9ALPH|nr:DNA polymerase [Vulture herpesvirus]